MNYLNTHQDHVKTNKKCTKTMYVLIYCNVVLKCAVITVSELVQIAPIMNFYFIANFSEICTISV